MEEDTGKSLHVGGATGRIHGADHSLVDYNRAGIPLIEIVTKPIPGTREQAPLVARAYVAQLRELLLGLGVSDVRMEQGSLRCDVNLSLAPGRLRRRSAPAPRPRTSTRCARSSGRCATRSAGRPRCSTAGGSIVQETRHWHEDTGITTSGREKSDAEDYRYFPEPDLVPVAPSREWVEQLRARAARAAARAPRPAAAGVGLQRPGDARHRRRRRARPGRGDRRRGRLAGGGPQVVALGDGPPRQRAGRRARRAAGHPGRRGAGAGARRRGQDQRQAGPAGASTACSPARARPDEVVAARGLAVVSDEGALSAAVDRAIEANPDVADKIRDGKVAAAGALIGAVMKEMRGQADAGRVRELILEKLS